MENTRIWNEKHTISRSYHGASQIREESKIYSPRMMITLLFLTSTLSILAFFCSTLAYSFGNHTLCDLSGWVGWFGITIVVFSVIGIMIIKAIEAIFSVLLKKSPFSNIRSKIAAGKGQTVEWRKFLRYFIDFVILTCSALMAVHGLSEGLRIPRVKDVIVEIENLPSALERFSIVQVSDLHVSSSIRRNWVEKVVERANALHPDIIAFTGDIADAGYEEIKNDIAPLADLTARFGKFFVTGNHEYMVGAKQWIQAMENLGFTVLQNEYRIISRSRGLILLGGVVDYRAPSRIGQASNPEATLGKGVDADLKILLAHQPQSVYNATKAGFDLQLSGHTHGGIFSPIRWIASFAQPFQSGLYKYKNIQLYVSNGTGYWGIPLRYGTPSEITLLKLTKSKRN